MDWIAEERNHEFRMEQEHTRQIAAKAQARAETIQAVAIAVGIIATIGIVIGGIVYSVEGNSDREHAERIACVENGGTVVDTASGLLCVGGDTE